MGVRRGGRSRRVQQLRKPGDRTGHRRRLFFSPAVDRSVIGDSGNPEFGTVMRVLRALGLTLSVRPARKKKRAPGKRRAA